MKDEKKEKKTPKLSIEFTMDKDGNLLGKTRKASNREVSLEECLAFIDFVQKQLEEIGNNWLRHYTADRIRDLMRGGPRARKERKERKENV